MRVMLATPSLDGVPSIEYQTSVMRTNLLLTSQGIAFDVNFIRGDPFIDKARNGLIQGFLDSPFNQDILFFVDDDEGWDEHAFLRMCLDPHEFVAAAVPKKSDSGEFNNVVMDLMPNNDCIIENGLIRAKQVGSGFIRLKRSAVEKMIKAYPRRYNPGDGGPYPLHYSLFDARVEWPSDPDKPGQFWGEDLEFCRKWVALGEYIWIDPNVSMTHTGRKVWSANFLQFLQKSCNVVLRQPESPLTAVARVVDQTPQPIPETLTALADIAA